MQHVQGLDHVIVLVRDLDEADAAMTRLGFRPTPRGLHSPAMGTANATVVFRDRSYIETLAVLSPTPANAAARAALARSEGLCGFILKSNDAQAAAAAFAAAGIGEGEALGFARPVLLREGERQAAFTIARVRPAASPGAWLFVCQHHTPEVVWREDYLDHPNGAVGVSEVVGVARDPGGIADAYRVIFAERLERRPEEVRIEAGGAVIRFLAPAALRARYGALADGVEGGAPRLVGMQVKVAELDHARRLLEANGVMPVQRPDGTLQVPPAAGCGTVLELGR
jgi:hypothetical protein